jgi:hypothetical protein
MKPEQVFALADATTNRANTGSGVGNGEDGDAEDDEEDAFDASLSGVAGTLLKHEQVTRSSYATLPGVGGGHHGHQEEESSISAFGGQLVSIGIPVDGDSGGGAAPFSFGGVFGVGDPMQIVTGRMAGGDAGHWGFGQPGETLNFNLPVGPVGPVGELSRGSSGDLTTGGGRKKRRQTHPTTTTADTTAATAATAAIATADIVPATTTASDSAVGVADDSWLSLVGSASAYAGQSFNGGDSVDTINGAVISTAGGLFPLCGGHHVDYLSLGEECIKLSESENSYGSQ